MDYYIKYLTKQYTHISHNVIDNGYTGLVTTKNDYRVWFACDYWRITNEHWIDLHVSLLFCLPVTGASHCHEATMAQRLHRKPTCGAWMHITQQVMYDLSKSTRQTSATWWGCTGPGLCISWSASLSYLSWSAASGTWYSRIRRSRLGAYDFQSFSLRLSTRSDCAFSSL